MFVLLHLNLVISIKNFAERIKYFIENIIFVLQLCKKYGLKINIYYINLIFRCLILLKK